jgi:hypothetical protein
MKEQTRITLLGPALCSDHRSSSRDLNPRIVVDSRTDWIVPSSSFDRSTIPMVHTSSVGCTTNHRKVLVDLKTVN